MATKKPEKMSEEDLVNLCKAEWDEAEEYSSLIRLERQAALNEYNSEPYGNEEDGLSKYVASDIRDAAQWVLPQLVDVFVSGETPILFEAENADDVKQAENESKRCHYAFTRENKGTLVATQWFQDALIQKNGIIKAFWDHSEVKTREEYNNKHPDEYLQLVADEEFEIKEVTVYLEDTEYTLKEFEDALKQVSEIDPETAAEMAASSTYDVVGHRTRKIGKPVIENVPVENFRIRARHNSVIIKEASYCAEEYQKTRSELIEMGYDKEVIMKLKAATSLDINSESQNRFKKTSRNSRQNVPMVSDPSRELLDIKDHYIRVDFDGDGISELRMVRIVGETFDGLLENDEVDRNVYHALTPYLNSHQFWGRSLADNLRDLQKAKTQLMRSVFDNITYSTVPRKIVFGNVSYEDLMTYIPGGIIRKLDDKATIENDQIPFVANECFPLIDKIDDLRAERTGFSKDTMGLNPAALSDSTNLMGMTVLAQSQLLVKMIATIFANTGVDELFLHLRELINKNEDRQRMFDLAGEWYETDPREWRSYRSAFPKVGIGQAGKQEQLMMLDKLMSVQKQLIDAQGGSIDGAMINPQNLFNTVKRLCNLIGFRDVESYVSDPAKYQKPPPQPSIAEITAKAAIDESAAKIQQKEAENFMKMRDSNINLAVKRAELEQKERLANAERESREYLAELDLLLKYNVSAQERSQAMTDRLEKRLAAQSKAIDIRVEDPENPMISKKPKKETENDSEKEEPGEAGEEKPEETEQPDPDTGPEGQETD